MREPILERESTVLRSSHLLQKNELDHETKKEIESISDNASNRDDRLTIKNDNMVNKDEVRARKALGLGSEKKTVSHSATRVHGEEEKIRYTR